MTSTSSNNGRAESAQQRRPYERPRLRMIELTVEETMATGCKTPATGTAFGASPCTVTNCSQVGS